MHTYVNAFASASTEDHRSDMDLSLAANPSVVETVAQHVESNVSVWILVLAAIGPVLGIAGILLGIVRWLLPIFREEKAADRELRAKENQLTRDHYTALHEQRLAATNAEMDAQRKMADTQHQRITEHVSGKVDRLSEQVGEVRRTTSAIAAKLGVGTALILLLALSAYSWRVVYMASKCEPPCPVGQKCKTAHPRTCVEDKKPETAKDKQKMATQPRSAVRFEAFAFYAADGRSARQFEM